MVYSDKPGGEIDWQSIPMNTMTDAWSVSSVEVSSGLASVSKTQYYDLPPG